MLRGKKLRDRVFHLIAAEGQPAPRRIPRKLKRAWKREVLREVRSRWPKGEWPRMRLTWVPYQGWTLTIVRRAYEIGPVPCRLISSATAKST